MRPVAGEGAAALLGRWRKAQLERTWRLNRDRVTAAALKEVAPELPTESREPRGAVVDCARLSGRRGDARDIGVGGSAASLPLERGHRPDQANMPALDEPSRRTQREGQGNARGSGR